jgi:hypothetical protein
MMDGTTWKSNMFRRSHLKQNHINYYYYQLLFFPYQLLLFPVAIFSSSKLYKMTAEPPPASVATDDQLVGMLKEFSLGEKTVLDVQAMINTRVQARATEKKIKFRIAKMRSSRGCKPLWNQVTLDLAPPSASDSRATSRRTLRSRPST